ncbi:hypothetical protein [Streptomyces sp. NPDC058701]|uniref:hypothetical protein n=1 Tax=Streptomyces sp. NPDC058701 TaxID=3346608 RepID=UPI00364CA0FA
MFDDARVKALIESIEPFQRGLLVTACLVRISGLLADERVTSEYPEASALVGQIRDFALGRSAGKEQEGAALRFEQGLRDFLGPRDEPFEELPDAGAWAMDIASLADCVLDVWSNPSESVAKCFEVLISGYSITGYLTDDSDDPDVPDLADGEYQRQIADIEAMRSGDTWERVLRPSVELAHTYAHWFQHVSM